MKLVHRGLEIELDDADARVRVIETLLYGGPLPPPLPAPVLADVNAAPTPVQVPADVRAFWGRLPELARRELVFLLSGPCKGTTLEKAMGVSSNELMGCHSSLTRLSNNERSALYVRRRGRTRAGCSYFITDKCAAMVRQIVAAGLAEGLPPPRV